MKGVKFRVFSTVSAAIGLTLGLAGLSRAEHPDAQRNVPHWASPANHVASAADSDRVTIVAYLSLRNVSALKDLIAAQSAPESARYGQYLTPEQFHAQFSPKAADVQRVAAFAGEARFPHRSRARQRVVREGERQCRPGQGHFRRQPGTLFLQRQAAARQCRDAADPGRNFRCGHSCGGSRSERDPSTAQPHTVE